MTTGTVTFHRVLRCPPLRIHKAFTTPAAMAKWLPPHGYVCDVHQMEVREGGSYRMSFTHLDSGHSHSFGGRYLEIVPGERLSYTATFDDPNLPGEMTTRVVLKPVFCGTEVRIEQSGIPSAIPAESCYLGWQESLQLLSLLVVAETPG